MKLKLDNKLFGRRILAATLAFVFLCQSAQPVQAQVLGKAQAGAGGPFLFQKTQLPESLVWTEERFIGKGPEMIWILRDAHAVPDAQNVIRRTVAELCKRAKVQTVAVEGVSGDFHTAFFRAFPDQKFLTTEFKKMWAKGELSGAALAALTGPNADFFGAENTLLYAKELKAFFSARSKTDSYQAALAGSNQQIEKLRSEIFSKELNEFEILRAASKRNDANATLSILKLAKEQINRFSQKFPHLAAVEKEAASSTDPSVHAALLLWADQIRRRAQLNQKASAQWNAEEQAWKTGQTTDAAFAVQALSFCRTQKWKPHLPAELKNFIRHGQLLNRLRAGIFMREWDALLTSMETKLAVHSDARALVAAIKQFENLSAALKLELTRDDWIKIQSITTPEKGKTNQLQTNLESLRLKLMRSEFAEFYKVAEAREAAILKNTLARLNQTGSTSAVMIVGGFHADAMAAELKRKKISYAILTPNISELPADNHYDALMRGDVSWKKFIQKENGKIKLYESFARATAHKLLDLEGERKDPTRALQYYKTWRENLIREAHGKNTRKNLSALSLLDEIVLESVYPNEYPALRQKWQPIAKKIAPVFERLKKSGKPNSFSAMPTFTAADQFGSPIVEFGVLVSVPQAEPLSQNVATSSAGTPRSVSKNLKERPEVRKKAPWDNEPGLANRALSWVVPRVIPIFVGAGLIFLIAHAVVNIYSSSNKQQAFREAEEAAERARVEEAAEIVKQRTRSPAAERSESRVVHASYEMAGLVDVGGVKDVIRELSGAQSSAGTATEDVRVVLPGNPVIHRNLAKAGLQPRELEDKAFSFWFFNPFTHRDQEAHFKVFEVIYHGVRVNFMETDGFFKWGYPEHDDFALLEATLFSKAFVTFVGSLEERPNILHLHDVQAAMIAPLIRFKEDESPAALRDSPFRETEMVYTIHNIRNQLRVPKDGTQFYSFMRSIGIPHAALAPMGALEFYGDINPAKAALLLVGKITTVSQTYRDELLRSEAAAYGLSSILNARQKDFHGILNALDDAEWNPGKANGISVPFSVENFEARVGNKAALLQKHGIEPNEENMARPVFAFLGRFDDQKGLDVILRHLDEMIQLYNPIILFAGAKKEKTENPYVRAVSGKEQQYPDHVFYAGWADEQTVRDWAAGSDIFLIPSKFEPAGISQQQFMRYGTMAIGRAVGGLIETIIDEMLKPGEGTGLLFLHDGEFMKTIQIAMDLFKQQPERFRAMQKRGMLHIKSWDVPAAAYEKVYEEAKRNRLDWLAHRPEQRQLTGALLVSGAMGVAATFVTQAPVIHLFGPARERAEFRDPAAKFVNPVNFPHLSKHTIYSRQFEAGLPRDLLNKIEDTALQAGADGLVKEFGWISPALAAQIVSQVTLTGGLGALMPDLFEAWAANGMPVTGIHPMWNFIKNRPGKGEKQNGERVYLGAIAKSKMTLTNIEFEVRRPILQKFRDYARFHNSSVQQVLNEKGHREIKVRVYYTESEIHKSPQYYLDAYYKNDQGEEVSLFGEVYDDNHPMRDFHMAIFSEASQKLVVELERRKQNTDLKNIVLLDHEIFTSLPAKLLGRAKLMTLNHTVFRPGLYEPSEASYELLGFPNWLRPFIIVRDPRNNEVKISIADYTAFVYDRITGVGLVEHLPALLKNIFRWAAHKVLGWYDGLRRSTNGVHLPRWESPSRRHLKQYFKQQLKMKKPMWNLPEEANDRKLFSRLDRPENAELKKEFMEKNELVGGADTAELLIWLYETHKVNWLFDTMGAYMEKNGIEGPEQMIAVLRTYQKNVAEYVESTRLGTSQKTWADFLIENPGYQALADMLLKDPIAANVRRQVPYKGPDKYEEILESILFEELEQTLRAAAVEAGDEFSRRDWEKISGDNESDRFFEEWKKDPENEKFKKYKARLANTKVIKNLRETMSRVIIGGRTFDEEDAYRRFLKIRFLTQVMGLEDRIVTLDEYNYHEAEIIFRGVQAGIMLSDEDLEASATSMMKVLANMGEVIGVFGGAVPEIWSIFSKFWKKIIKVLDKDGDPAITHDELRAREESGEWEILNGIPVYYKGRLKMNSETGEPLLDANGNAQFIDAEMSGQDGGKRRPSATSLLLALKKLRVYRADRATRMQRMYNVAASAWKVDMVTGQAQAHAHLLEGMLDESAKRDEVLSGAKLKDEDYFKIAQKDPFRWKVRAHQEVTHLGGLIGLVSGFNHLKTWEKLQDDKGRQKNSRGEDAQASLLFHSQNGNFFDYLLFGLEGLSDGVEPIRKAIRDLRDKAKGVKKARIRAAINSRAIELVDQFLLKAAGDWFEAYMNTNDPKRIAALQNVLKQSAYLDSERNEIQQPWAKYIARYLESHPNARILPTSDHRVPSFVFEKNGKSFLINLSVNAPTKKRQPMQGGETEDKSLAVIYMDEEAARALGGASFGPGKSYLLREAKSGIDFNRHAAEQLIQTVNTGISLPLGIEVLEWQLVDDSTVKRVATPERAGRSSDTLRLLRMQALNLSQASEVQIAGGDAMRTFSSGSPSDFKQQIEALAGLDQSQVMETFTEGDRRVVMTFVLMLEPSFIESFKLWDSKFFDQLIAFREKNKKFFELNVKAEVIASFNRDDTLSFARKSEDGDWWFVSTLLQVNPGEVHAGKVSLLLTGLQNLLGSGPFKVMDGLSGSDYPRHSDLGSKWEHKVPAQEQMQFLILTPDRAEARSVYRSEERQIKTVVHITYEMEPFFKSGGVATVMRDLVKKQTDIFPGTNYIGVMPEHSAIGVRGRSEVGRFELEVDHGLGAKGRVKEKFIIWHRKVGKANIYTLEHDSPAGEYKLFQEGVNDDRVNLFYEASMFSRAAFEAIHTLRIMPDILHAHDALAALTLPLAKYNTGNYPEFELTARIYTIHNLGLHYQKQWSVQDVPVLRSFGLPDEFFDDPIIGAVHHGQINLAKAGIHYAHVVTTVDENYRGETLTQIAGDGLEGTLRARGDDYVVVPNAVALEGTFAERWRDQWGNHKGFFDSKKQQKEIVRKQFELPRTGLLGVVISRQVEEKGIHLLIQALREQAQIFSSSAWIVLGTGGLAVKLEELQRDYPARFRFLNFFGDGGLKSLLRQGADLTVAASHREPFGLVPLEFMAQGALPIVNPVGGLLNMVRDGPLGNGFKMNEWSAAGLGAQILRANDLFLGMPTVFQKMQLRAMQNVPDWSGPARLYQDAYELALVKVRGEARTPYFEQHLAQIEAKFRAASEKFVIYNHSLKHWEIWASSTGWFKRPWGRDTFISLVGLLLTTGRFEEARSIFKAFADREKNGLLPNQIFEDEKGVETKVEYNSVDAPMWFLQAVRNYIKATNDWAFVATILPRMRNIMVGFETGTKFEVIRGAGRSEADTDTKIYMDPKDKLIRSPAQTTWMDAWPAGLDPVTKRNGKAVEVNALWHANLRFMASVEKHFNNDRGAEHFSDLANKVKASFNKRFWNPAFNIKDADVKTPLFDVIDGDPHKGALRPNMLYAVALDDLDADEKEKLLPRGMRAVVLEVARRKLLTPFGLRTLSPDDSYYHGVYNTFDPQHVKDDSYHQGTGWTHLMGVYSDVLVRVRRDQKVSAADIQLETENLFTPLVQTLMEEQDPNKTLPEVYAGNSFSAKPPSEMEGAAHDPERRMKSYHGSDALGWWFAGGTDSQAWGPAEIMRALSTYAGLNFKRTEFRARTIEGADGFSTAALKVNPPRERAEARDVNNHDGAQERLPLAFARGATGKNLSSRSVALLVAWSGFIFSIFGSLAHAEPYYAAVNLSAEHRSHFVPKVIETSMQSMVAQYSDLRGTGANHFTETLNLLDVYATAHFAKHPKTKLHLGFAMPHSPEMEKGFLTYTEKIEELKTEPDFLIENHMTLLLPKTPSVRALEFAKQIGKVAKVQRVTSVAATKVFLMGNQDVFTFNLEEFGITAEELQEFRHLAVGAHGFPSSEILGAAALLNVATATAEAGITTEIVQAVSRAYSTFFGFDGQSLSIKSILDAALFEDKIRQLIASMA